MRKWVIVAILYATVLGVPAYAQHRDIDLHDYDDDLMRDLDKTIKYFEPDISGGNTQGAVDDADVLREGFKYTKDYFAKKGDTEDAVKISQKGLEFLDMALKRVNENDLEAAAAAAREVSATCRSCHDIYKPLNKK